MFAWVMCMVFSILSMLSKEPGVTCPVICVVWDFFVRNQLSLHDFVRASSSERIAQPDNRVVDTELRGNRSKRQTFRCVLKRIAVTAVVTLAIVMYRLSLNGTTVLFAQIGCAFDFLCNCKEQAPPISIGTKTRTHLPKIRWCDWRGVNTPFELSLTFIVTTR